MWPMNSLHKGPVTRKRFPFDDAIMIYWSINKMTKILQTTFWNAFSCVKDCCILIKINDGPIEKHLHWFRWWLGTEQATTHLEEAVMIKFDAYTLGLNVLAAGLRLMKFCWMTVDSYLNIVFQVSRTCFWWCRPHNVGRFVHAPARYLLVA